MDEEEKGFELAVAKSLVEIQKLEAQKQSQQQLLAEHFKNTMAITDADFGKLSSDMSFILSLLLFLFLTITLAQSVCGFSIFAPLSLSSCSCLLSLFMLF